MRKLLILTAAVLVTAMVAGPALAAVQNVRVSGSVDSTYVYRRNFDFGTEEVDQRQSIFITQTLLQVDADLTDQVAATIALINERVWDEPDSTTTDIDVLLAYVTLREMLYSPLTLVIGRQSFAFGNSLIIDSAGTNNAAPSDSNLQGIANDLTKQTTLDAFRATLDYNPLTIDIVYAQIEETNSGDFTNKGVGTDQVIAGINANYLLGDDYDSVVEAYFWKKHDKTATASPKSDKVYSIGGRISTNPMEGLNLQVENAYQKGTHVWSTSGNSSRRDAWIFQFISNYQIPMAEEYNPTLQYVYTKATGNAEGDGVGGGDNGDTNDYTGWDPMLENQAGGKIYNSIFNLSNIEIHQVTLGFNPMEDVLAKISLAGLWLERKYQANAVGDYPLTHPGGTDDNFNGSVDVKNDRLGKELDLELIYDYTEDVQIAGNFGWFLPGGFFPSDNNQSAKQAIVNVNVNF